MEELKENQTDIQLDVQRTQNNHNKKQQHEQMEGIRDMPKSSYISDDAMENWNDKCPMDPWVKGETSALQPEVSTKAEELEQLCSKQVTAADIQLERMSLAKDSMTSCGLQTSMPCSYAASSLFMLFIQ
ncbi:uncharacterized protein [Struthio camelus]|uniref:uncharacterized protein isoform X4 n=1 Tax=Struthio camelus TaxID=8801 RepID=UPI00360424C1